MIIDNPHIMRELVAEVNPYFTHPGAEEIYMEKKELMDEYAKRYGDLADKIWSEEYVNNRPKN